MWYPSDVNMAAIFHFLENRSVMALSRRKECFHQQKQRHTNAGKRDDFSIFERGKIYVCGTTELWGHLIFTFFLSIYLPQKDAILLSNLPVLLVFVAVVKLG